MYQTTMRIEGFVTIESSRRLKEDEIPVILEVSPENFDRGMSIIPVESDITKRVIQTVVKC